MDKSNQEYYDDYFEMFNTDGWRTFKEEEEQELTNAKNTAHLVCITNDQWQIHKGQISTLEALVNFENFIKQSYEIVINEETEEGQG